MKPFMVLKDPEAYALLADETRRKILYLLRVKEMNVSQIAKELGVTSQAIYHHVKKLLAGNMLEVAREERVGHLIESYYRATAEDFLLSHGRIKSSSLHDRKNLEEQVTSVLNALKDLGLDLEYDKRKISQLVDTEIALKDCCKPNAEIEDGIWNKDDLDIPARMMAADFAGALSISEEVFSKQQSAREKRRNLLLSLLRRDVQVPATVDASN